MAREYKILALNISVGQKMIRPIITAGLALTLLLHLASCSKTQQTPPSQQKSQKDQLVGLWERQWEYGPVIYQRELQADGSAIFREFRKPSSSDTKSANSQPDSQPVAKTDGAMAYHNYYKTALVLTQERKGTWAIQDGIVCYKVQLSPGQVLEIPCRAVRVSGSELVEASDGVAGASQVKYQRKK
jgi:hypothetical protein